MHVKPGLFVRVCWANTDSITKWIQTIALIAAGFWTYARYFRVEAPSLEPRLAVDAKIEEVKPSPVPHTCFVNLNVAITNNGNVSFDVRKIHIRGWRTELPQAGSSPATPVDVHSFEKGLRIIDEDPPPGVLLLRHFVPQEKSQQSFSFLFRKEPVGVHMFMVDVEVAHGKKLIPASVRRWEIGMCAGGPNTPIAVPPSMPVPEHLSEAPPPDGMKTPEQLLQELQQMQRKQQEESQGSIARDGRPK